MKINFLLCLLAAFLACMPNYTNYRSYDYLQTVPQVSNDYCVICEFTTNGDNQELIYDFAREIRLRKGEAKVYNKDWNQFCVVLDQLTWQKANEIKNYWASFTQPIHSTIKKGPQQFVFKLFPHYEPGERKFYICLGCAKNINAAKGILKNYESDDLPLEIKYSKNGHYAVVIGKFSKAEGEDLVKYLKKRSTIQVEEGTYLLPETSFVDSY